MRTCFERETSEVSDFWMTMPIPKEDKNKPNFSDFKIKMN